MGLDVIMVTAYGYINSFGAAVAGAYCPSDHPYLIGGSATQAELGPGDTIVDEGIIGPVGQYLFDGAWYAFMDTAALVSPANGVLSFAWCAK
jgi:hypothetical protein